MSRARSVRRSPRDQKGLGAEGDERELPLVGAAQQIHDLEPRPRQARRRDVLRLHARGQIEQ